MRIADEEHLWEDLRLAMAGKGSLIVELPNGQALEFSDPVTVIGGLNGAGKSRLLRYLAAALGNEGLLLDLHRLSEQTLAIIQSRADIEDMTEEFDPGGPDVERLDDLRRVVGMQYHEVEWFALELELADGDVARRFRWAEPADGQSLVPYFRAVHNGRKYSSLDMGLGEFAAHLLFWILEQYRDVAPLTLLLDEPDAFLPPVGVSALLHRLIGLCLKRGWRLILTTHSEEMITHAVRNSSFMLLRRSADGETVFQFASDDTSVASHLLTRVPIENMIFCEDESAWYLTRAVLDHASLALSAATSVVWGKGEGYLRELVKHLPRPPLPEVRFAVAPDGDQRAKFDAKGRWPVCFLPTEADPDDLFRTLGDDPQRLAERLGATPADLERFLDTLLGVDRHDWVNKLGDRYGRAHTLATLAHLWVEDHPQEARDFAKGLQSAWFKP